jgi:hypothetical protein
MRKGEDPAGGLMGDENQTPLSTPPPDTGAPPEPAPAVQEKPVRAKGKFPFSRHSHSLLFLILLFFDVAAATLFVQLAHFRALTGWDSEMDFDSLTFNWRAVCKTVSFFDLLGWLAMVLGFWHKDVYRYLWFFLAPLFLVNVVFPFGMAFHYLRGFYFPLLLGMLLNGWAFAVLAFSKRKLGLIERVPEAGNGDG